MPQGVLLDLGDVGNGIMPFSKPVEIAGGMRPESLRPAGFYRDIALGKSRGSRIDPWTAAVHVTGLEPGVYRGVLTLLFSDGSVRTINQLFVVRPGVAAEPRPVSRRDAAGCAPTRLLPLRAGAL